MSLPNFKSIAAMVSICANLFTTKPCAVCYGKNATTKIAALHRMRTRFGWFQLVDSDWDQAGLLWVQAVSKGRQLADVDLLIAAIALRQDAILVSDDNDFDALPVKRENWRT